VGLLDFCCSQCVLMKLLLYSHQVPNVLPNMFPIASSFYPISFCPKCYSCNLIKQPKGPNYNISILGLSKAWFIYLYFFCDGPFKDAHPKTKIELWSSPQLINIIHNVQAPLFWQCAYPGPGLFIYYYLFFHFCDVAEVVIIHKMI